MMSEVLMLSTTEYNFTKKEIFAANFSNNFLKGAAFET